ncbi:hypothetical protein SLS63_008715 [Diaporthe eres]|uniref:Cytochrome P450 n=1 Tax=Diaporthe eres TaxID=83184 RepID=A0ABR1P1M8_DIAER
MVYYGRQYYRLSHIPGPFLARFSNIPRFLWVYQRDAHNVHIAQHRQYAKIGSKWAALVRYGPNAVSVGSAAAVETIYRMRGDPLLKSDFYSVIPPMRKGTILPTIFATQDEMQHRMLKRPIAAVYSMSNLVSFEPLVDRTIDVFRQELDRRFVLQGNFDVVGEITFSKRLGFLEEGRDVEGIMASIWQWFEYVAIKPMSRALRAWTSSNIIAGSDTTAIFLRTMFHQLLAHPESMSRLQEELDSAAARGALSETTTWKESQALSYLSACFKEAGRVHPPFGLHLERVVPAGGLDVCGAALPAGTIVGMNAWVVHRDPDIFGPDADAWRPERWLEGDEARIKRMDAALSTCSLSPPTHAP